MPEWDIPLQDNRIFKQTYKKFMEHYYHGDDVESISQYLIERSENHINDLFDAHPFWFALAYAQWKVNNLDPAVYARVKEIIEAGKDVDVWRYQVMPVRLKRQQALEAFLKEINPVGTTSDEPNEYELAGIYKEINRLLSPDKEKELVMYELQEDGEVFTSAFFCSAGCNADIFKAVHTGWEIKVEWETDHKLVIKHPARMTFDEDTIEVYMKGKTISIFYEEVEDKRCFKRQNA